MDSKDVAVYRNDFCGAVRCGAVRLLRLRFLGKTFVEESPKNSDLFFGPNSMQKHLKHIFELN